MHENSAFLDLVSVRMIAKFHAGRSRIGVDRARCASDTIHMNLCNDHPEDAGIDPRKASNTSPRQGCAAHEHPLVDPQLSHLRHVPLRTIVKFPHSEQLSPS